MTQKTPVSPIQKSSEGPKRPKSACLHWLDENRERIIGEHKGKPESWMAAAGEEWRTVSDKSKWEQMEEEDKRRYADEKEVSLAAEKKAVH